MGIQIIGLIITTLVLSVNLISADTDIQVYRKAQQAAREGQTDFAFMHYRALLRNYPQSRYRLTASFALGEYHFLAPNYKKAGEYFQRIIEEFPDAEEKIFALVYLLKIAEKADDTERIQMLSSAIAHARQVSLVFQDFEEYKYTSPLNHLHHVVFHIDRIEFYVEGALLEKITY